LVNDMAQEDRTYVITPADTDPGLLRSLTPLGDAVGAPAGRRQRRRRASGTANRTAARVAPPAHPALLLVAAYLLGPAALLVASADRRHRWCRIAIAVAAASAAVAAIAWWKAAILFGPRDAATLVQVATAAVATIAWVTVWSAGIWRAAGRCGEGPWSLPGRRRPVAAAAIGFVAPGLGLLLTGHARRAIATIVLVGVAVLAGLACLQVDTWWSWHRRWSPAPATDLHFEYGVLVAVGLAAAGSLAWLVSALDGARLATGPQAMRRVAVANRAPAALLAALIAFVAFYRPAGIAGDLDLATQRFADRGFRVLPLCTAVAATYLDPAEPLFAWRLAERLDALGRTADAAVARDALADRWRRYVASVGPAEMSAR